MSSGAQAAVRDNAATVPMVYVAARMTSGPPSNIKGAITRPTTPLWTKTEQKYHVYNYENNFKSNPFNYITNFSI